MSVKRTELDLKVAVGEVARVCRGVVWQLVTRCRLDCSNVDPYEVRRSHVDPFCEAYILNSSF